MTNITSANITMKARLITAIKAVALAFLVVLVAQSIIDECIIAMIKSDITLWFKWTYHYYTRFLTAVCVLSFVYYIKGIKKIVEKARKANDRLRYHLYDNSNPQ